MCTVYCICIVLHSSLHVLINCNFMVLTFTLYFKLHHMVIRQTNEIFYVIERGKEKEKGREGERREERGKQRRWESGDETYCNVIILY